MLDLAADVDRGALFRYIIPKAEGVDAHLKVLLDCKDVIVCYCIVECIQTLWLRRDIRGLDVLCPVFLDAGQTGSHIETTDCHYS